MGSYGEIRPDFYDERTRILEALATDANRHILLRLIGALAFRTHCPQFGFFKDIQRLLGELGYQEDKMVSRLFGEHRMLFHAPLHGRHIDIFFDQLHFSHTLPPAGRLEAEDLTLPLAELFLEKAQIVQANEKDLIDAVMLLREHPIGGGGHETINA